MRPGDWFVQNGANGAVGRAAVQLGRLWGFRSINVVRARAEGREADEVLEMELRRLGADVVVREDEVLRGDFPDRVKSCWTDGGRDAVRLGLNCVGGKAATAIAKVLDPGGQVVTYGAMARQPVVLPAGLLIFKDVGFRGFWVSSWSEKFPDEKTRTVEHVLDLIRQGKLEDGPYREVRWDWDTKEETLKSAVEGTLDGFRDGKGIFVFGDT